jgi:hypothetical protein
VITSNTDKSFSRSSAKAGRIDRIKKQITPAERRAVYLFSDLYRCVRIGILHWDDLTEVQKITFQEYYTDKLIQFLDLGNQYVNRSIPYRLREKEQEEEEEEQEGTLRMSSAYYEDQLKLYWSESKRCNTYECTVFHGLSCNCCTRARITECGNEKRGKWNKRQGLGGSQL